MEKNLEIKLVKLNDSSFDVEIYEPESGDFTRERFVYPQRTRSGFNEIVGNKIYSWIEILMDGK